MIRKLLNNHLVMSGFYKGGSGLALFLSVPLLINYLGNESYSVWVLVFTLFQWILLMDFGIQSSLKTKIPVLLHEGKIDLIKIHIKETYKISFYIAAGLFLLSLLTINFIDVRNILNITSHSSFFVKSLFILNIFFFCGNFVASIHKSLYVSFLKGKYTEQSLAVNQIGFLFLTVCLIYILPNTTNENKLILISVINGLFCLFVNIFYTIKFFKIEKISLITPLRGVKNIKTEILKMGSKFMIIQVSWVFLFNLDNYLVSNNFSPSIVVPFDCINKLFQFPLMILMAAMSPLWSMFAKDYLDKNHKALFKKFKNFNLLFIVILILLIVFALLCPFIISIWIKQKLEIPNYLIFYITILTAMRIFVNYYMFFLSGIGKVKNYIRILIISVILKLPLTYFFIHLGLGINSVVLSTLLLILIWTVFLPLESYKTVYSLKKQ